MIPTFAWDVDSEDGPKVWKERETRKRSTGLVDLCNVVLADLFIQNLGDSMQLGYKVDDSQAAEAEAILGPLLETGEQVLLLLLGGNPDNKADLIAITDRQILNLSLKKPDMPPIAWALQDFESISEKKMLGVHLRKRSGATVNVGYFRPKDETVFFETLASAMQAQPVYQERARSIAEREVRAVGYKFSVDSGTIRLNPFLEDDEIILFAGVLVPQRGFSGDTLVLTQKRIMVFEFERFGESFVTSNYFNNLTESVCASSGIRVTDNLGNQLNLGQLKHDKQDLPVVKEILTQHVALQEKPRGVMDNGQEAQLGHLVDEDKASKAEAILGALMKTGEKVLLLLIGSNSDNKSDIIAVTNLQLLNISLKNPDSVPITWALRDFESISEIKITAVRLRKWDGSTAKIGLILHRSKDEKMFVETLTSAIQAQPDYQERARSIAEREVRAVGYKFSDDSGAIVARRLNPFLEDDEIILFAGIFRPQSGPSGDTLVLTQKRIMVFEFERFGESFVTSNYFNNLVKFACTSSGISVTDNLGNQLNLGRLKHDKQDLPGVKEILTQHVAVREKPRQIMDAEQEANEVISTISIESAAAPPAAGGGFRYTPHGFSRKCAGGVAPESGNRDTVPAHAAPITHPQALIAPVTPKNRGEGDRNDTGSESKFCTNCGSPRNVGQKFCETCGQAL